MLKKLSCKYRQVWSCLADPIIRKIMVQSKINLNARLKSYCFFNSDFAYMWMMLALLSKSACINKFSSVIYATLKWAAPNVRFRWWFAKSSLEAMYNHARVTSPSALSASTRRRARGRGREASAVLGLLYFWKDRGHQRAAGADGGRHALWPQRRHACRAQQCQCAAFSFLVWNAFCNFRWCPWRPCACMLEFCSWY